MTCLNTVLFETGDVLAYSQSHPVIESLQDSCNYCRKALMCCLWLKGEISWEDSYWPAQTVKCVLATITDNNSKLQCTFSSIWQYQPCCTLVNILLFISYLNSLVCIFVTDLGRGSLWFQPLPVNSICQYVCCWCWGRAAMFHSTCSFSLPLISFRDT